VPSHEELEKFLGAPRFKNRRLFMVERAARGDTGELDWEIVAFFPVANKEIALELGARALRRPSLLRVSDVEKEIS
jgi:hypothetical protein